MASKAEAIQGFWSWWSTARPRIEQAIPGGPQPELVDEMTRHVHAIDAGLSWELGAGQRARHSLCVTPEGKPELRAVTERWVRAGPAPDADWEYHPARPASLDALEATLGIGGRRLNPAEARLHLRVDEDRQLVDVGVYHPILRKLRKGTRGTVAFLLLDWLLGEDGVERWVGLTDIHLKEPKDTVAAEALPEIVQGLAERHPEPTFALLQGADEEGPILAVARRPLKRIEWPLFDLHGRLTVPLTGINRAGAGDLFERFEDLQDDLEATLAEQAVVVVRETRPDRRSLHLYCDGEGRAPELVESWRTAQPVPVTVVWEHDPDWNAVRPFR